MSWQGFPGRQLLKNQVGVHALSTNLPPAASPGARVRLLMERCGCAQGCSIAPSSMAGSWPCSRHPKGVVCFGLLWVSPSSACQVLLFLCYPLQVQPGAAALCPVGVQGLGGECRCPAQCFGCTPLKAPLLPSQAPAMGEVKCCCCCKGPDGSTKAKP